MVAVGNSGDTLTFACGKSKPKTADSEVSAELKQGFLDGKDLRTMKFSRGKTRLGNSGGERKTGQKETWRRGRAGTGHFG